MALQGGFASPQSFCFLQYVPSGPVSDAFITLASRLSRQAFLGAKAAVASPPRSPGGFEGSPQTGSRGSGYREFTNSAQALAYCCFAAASQKFGLQKSITLMMFGSIDSFHKPSTYFSGPP